ncbi:chloramphenicol resistance protein [Streptomyces inusitatus]|uniref:Chloramphenicol resistance protein n=1 Tax=Streptomyces inusitatus TaxID=68221 RepID=A0A918PU20_9ACTN|nr:MFS transporter [Streptomyces inusitatus]GGZ22803.1 chloramphenicol resistance protein [Streptomyces inusitatus]
MNLVHLLGLGAFALGLDAYVTAGLLPVIADDFDSSVSATGQMVTAFTLAYAIASPIFATFLSASRVRAGLLGSLAVFALANAGSALSDSLPVLLVTRAFAGVGAGLYLALAAAAAASLVDKERRGRALAVIMGGMSSGTVIGVPAGVFIAEHTGWRSTLWLVTVLGFISFAGLALRLPALPATHSFSLRERAQVVTDPRVASIVGVSFLAAVASLGLYTYIAPVMATDAMGEVESITPYLWAWGIGGVIGSVLIGTLVDRVRRPYFLVVGALVLLVAALLAFRVTASIHPLIALLPIAIWGAVGWALQVPQQNDLLEARGEKGGPVAVALNESALYLGSAVGSGLGGLAFSLGRSGSVLPLWAAGAALLGLILQVTAVRTSSARRARPAPADTLTGGTD